jgi:holliday junction DNA helicase RuvA
MYEYIQGKIGELNPTSVVVDNQGIGYLVQISLNTYSALSGKENAVIFLYQVIREDAHILFGFYSKSEREVFRQLLSVSGIGANTARMILSSMSPMEIKEAILSGNVTQLNAIKGIGLKTAQRIILDLKDKIGKTDAGHDFLLPQNNTNREEALSALVMLGFPKNIVEKVLDKILKDSPSAKVEDLVKQALKSI